MSAFTIYPAIDLREGKCVRLRQGDYAQMTVYADDPVVVARDFAGQGADFLHVVDLDGAREGKPRNLSVIAEIVRTAGVPVQAGGGIRDRETLQALFRAGVARCVLGTAAIEDPEFVRQSLQEFGDRIVLGVDVKEGKVATRGWRETTAVSALELGYQLKAWGARLLVYTDIARDGMLQGPNVAAVVEIASHTGLQVIASGGVRGMEDILKLRAYAPFGVTGVIVGKALYAAGLHLGEAIQAVRTHDGTGGRTC
jgi:phosphoribosylformimino-5-aminoimidazole carboxamide ribotide isomerase